MKTSNVIMSALLGAFMALLVTLLVALVVDYHNEPTFNINDKHTTCCAITVEHLGDDTAVIFYADAVTPEFSYNIFVEVEYPEPDMLDWDVLQELIDETVERMQGDCKRHHQ